MIDDFIKFFNIIDYKLIQINVEGIYLYYTITSETANIVLILDYDKNQLNIDEVRQIKSQITWKFIGMNYKNIEFLSLFVGSDINKMKELCINEDTNWVIDKPFRRLIIYENQKSDFISLKKDILSITEGNYFGQKNKRKEAGYIALCNTVIVLINIIIFIICEALFHSNGGIDIYYQGALNSDLVFKGGYYRLLTYMFLHSGIGHIANNMLILFYLGSYLERILGRWKYTLLYFLTGIIAGLASIGYNNLLENNVISVGASGAVFGIAGALAYIIIINKGKVENISRTQMVIFIFLSLYGGFTSQGIDNAAHIGGLASGFLLAAILYRKTSNNKKWS